jgi:uncharacterized protein
MPVRQFVAAVLACWLAAMAAPATAQPSFDCSKAESGGTEAMICGDADLSAMDREVDRLYQKIREQTSAEDFKAIRAYQRGWIEGHNGKQAILASISSIPTVTASPCLASRPASLPSRTPFPTIAPAANSNN